MNRLWKGFLWGLLIGASACSNGSDKGDDSTAAKDLAVEIMLDSQPAEVADGRSLDGPTDAIGHDVGDTAFPDSLQLAETLDAVDGADAPVVLQGQWVQVNTTQLGEHVLKGVWGFDDGNVIAVGEAGLVAAKVKDAFSIAYQEPSLNILNGVWGSSASDIWTVGMYGLIYHYDGLDWGMPSNCATVEDCSFAGECLLAECIAGQCEYVPTGKKQCCGANHFETTFDMDSGGFTNEDLYLGTPDGGLGWSVVSATGGDGKPRYVSPPNALYFGNPGNANFANGNKVGATSTSPPVAVPATAEQVTLSFQLYLDVETSPYVDTLKVRVLNSGKWEDAWSKSNLSGNYLKTFVPVQVNLSKYVGKTVRFQFYFDSVTAENNALEGVYIDDVKLSSTCSVAGALAGKFPTLWSVWGASPESVYAVGSNGWILHYDGTSWQKHSSGELYPVAGVHGLSSQDVTLVGNGGLILHSTGEGWQEEDAGLSKDLSRVWATSAQKSVAIGPKGALAWSDGNQWHPSSKGGAGDLNGIIGLADDDYYIVGQTAKLIHYDGSDFIDITNLPTTMNLYGIWGNDASDMMLVGDKTVLTGPVTSLTQETVPIVAGWRAVWGTGEHRYVTGELGKMLHYDGSKWEKMVTGTEQSLLAIWGFGTDDIFAVGEAATIVHFDGEKWSPMDAFGTEETRFLDVWGSASDDVYVTAQIETDQGPLGYLLHFDGNSWKIALAGTAVNLRHIHGSSDENVFAVGQQGTIVRYDGKGWGLSPVDPIEQEDGSEYVVSQGLFGVFAQADDDVWAVGEGGVIAHYDGSSFKLSGLFDNTLRAVWGISPENLWAVGNAGVIMRFDGQQWSMEESGIVATIYAIWGDGAGNIYAVGDNGTVLTYVTD
jgi:hypothetical protein